MTVSSDRKEAIRERVNAVEHGNAMGGNYAVRIDDVRWLLAVVERYENALRAAMDELGVPGPDYPAPVANAYDILAAALAGTEERQ